MDNITATELQQLASDASKMCVSIYMTTHPTGVEAEQDTLRWNKLVQEAERALEDRGYRSTDAKELLLPAAKLPHDPVFWQNRSQGLAAFISNQTCSCYRLPQQFDDLATVGRRFHLKQLLPLMSHTSVYYVLTLSQNQARLFRATRFEIEQVAVPDLEKGIAEVLNYVNVDRGSQVHAATKGSPGKQAVVFHSQGGHKDTHKQDLKEYLRFVNDAINRIVSNRPAKVLLAGVDYLIPLFRDATSGLELYDQHLSGNCDHLTPTQLLERAWPIIEAEVRRNESVVFTKYASLPDRTVNQIESVLPAAHQGRIEVLFVDPHSVQWGTFNSENNTLHVSATPRAGDEDLLEEAVAETLLSRGKVCATESGQLAGDPSIAALLRY